MLLAASRLVIASAASARSYDRHRTLKLRQVASGRPCPMCGKPMIPDEVFDSRWRDTPGRGKQNAAFAAELTPDFFKDHMHPQTGAYMGYIAAAFHGLSRAKAQRLMQRLGLKPPKGSE